MPPDEPKNLDEFVRLLTGSQRRLFVYILSLLPDESAAGDVLQNTNEVLWQKREAFQPGTNFSAWAASIAYHQVLAHRKRRSLDRHIFDDDLLGKVAAAVGEVTAQTGSRLGYLEECLDELPGDQREIALSRYEPGVTVGDIAHRQGKSEAAVSQWLYRIRNRLLDCIEGKLAQEAQP